MAKLKSVWCCSECGQCQQRWSGQCPQCASWSTLHEELQQEPSAMRFASKSPRSSKPVRLKEVSLSESPRFSSGIGECDRIFGGGIVPGSLTLVGGHPGIGKSTLLLQLSQGLARQGKTVLYISGEESAEQTTLRAKRLGVDADRLFLLSETSYTLIKRAVEELNPDFLIIDSIQIIYKEEIHSAPGSVSQVRETTNELMHLAKGRGMAAFLIGHVTKSGEIAGPKVLEHLVDTVLYFEGDKQHHYRIIRVVKNRFGPTDEIAVFQMNASGLKEVPNPSKIFLEERRRDVIGSAIIPTLEGSRPILVEIQALVTETAFPAPSRRSAGIDQNRLALLLAVLEKRVGYPLFRCDVFASAAGGIRVLEPASDLGILIAVASSFRNKQIDPEMAVVGEVGLGGEIRSVPRLENRIKEALNMGFTACIVPKNSAKALQEAVPKGIALHPVEMVEEAIRLAIR